MRAPLFLASKIVGGCFLGETIGSWLERGV